MQPAMLREINIHIVALLQFFPSFLQVSDATKLRPKVEFCFGELNLPLCLPFTPEPRPHLDDVIHRCPHDAL